MGVHDLWSIVEPVRESVPLYSLSGKTLAVDLSLWVCEAQHVQAMMGRVTKPHLRNLFFRVSSLTLMGVKLVFVMEGEAPKLKAETMNKRTQARFGGVKKAAAPKPTKATGRGRFNAVLRECAQMLDYLGVPWLTAAGEAEAMCAYLDSQGLVDGCITNDGDAFVYGARTVYRNFNMNTKDPQVDCYKTSRVQSELHLSRENLVGLAIFLGCDYIPKGIQGVGREQALRLIKMIKGQTLLQRFIQWKEEKDTGVSEGVVKKVTHCNICRHPGSAKTHERSGCTLCDSKHFCQPQDFDYQCPCDWHQYEQTRQDSNFEANIKKKTLASIQFPFTEIIQEFLISRDKPVSHFKRRQPNILLMQKFAYDKMEWPKHYTSEKVLVLMTYAELMNKKYGKDMSSQIRPLRVFKPRVRNAIACFEIIWSVPEHYVFPEDYPAENQHEVRTVEEESLFRVAFPDVVESYMRDKALAEENKNKKKKPKTKKEKEQEKEKEKPSDAYDGISDLLAQMTLQTSSTTQPHMPLPSRSSPEEPAVMVLDTPVNHKHQQRSKEEQSSVGDCPGTPLAQADPVAAASPCVSAVIEALHLSNIDWDAASFMSSPTPQPAKSLTAQPEMSKTAESDAKRAESENTSGTKDSELCETDCSLRERLLLRNTAKAIAKMETHCDVVSKQPDYRLATLTPISHNNSKPNGLIPSKIISESKISVKEPEPIAVKKACALVRAGTVSRPALHTHSTTQLNSNVSLKPPQKYKFVKKAVSSSVAPQRCHSDPGQGVTDKSNKKSVCMSVCLSSEESDAENQQRGPRRRAKSKPVKKSSSVSGHKATKAAVKSTQIAQYFRPKPSQTETITAPGPSKISIQEVPPPDDDVFPQPPSSPVVVLDSDDSVICGESPLPLAERLRLKFHN